MGFKYIIDYDFKNNSNDDYENKYKENLDNEDIYFPEDSKMTDEIVNESREDEEQKIT